MNASDYNGGATETFMFESQLEKWIVSQAPHKLPIAIVLPSGRRIEIASPAKVEIRLKDLAAVRHLLDPTLGNLGSAYVEGDIDFIGKIDDILDVGLKLSDSTGGERFVLPTKSWRGRGRAHSKRRDKDSIAYHYDVSNEFYQLFLDANMVYSCAYFRSDDDTLDQAQLNKLDHILTKLQLRQGERFLDVGCGWGALIVRAAQRGARAVGVTLSQNQFDYAKEAIARLGLADRCEVRLQDYRDVPEAGGYDKIASVGMIEHVGMENLPTYFGKIHALLSDGGAVLMHGITSTHPDRRTVGRGAGDFLDQYVFPDGEVPHVSDVVRAMSLAGFEVVDLESLRRHYARTLTHWAQRLDAQPDRARETAGDKRYRIWRVFLAGCAVAFRDNWMNIHQMLACKLGPPGMNPFPMTREWIYRT